VAANRPEAEHVALQRHVEERRQNEAHQWTHQT
jgi:hypothetical protein